MDIDQPAVTRKGRGFKSGEPEDATAQYESLKQDELETAGALGNAARSIEGWIVIVTGLHEECSEEDLQDKFGDFGEIKNLHLNLDRRTGYVKGYALVEYETRAEAEAAISGASGTELLEQTLQCDFAFVRPPPSSEKASKPRRARSRIASYTLYLIVLCDHRLDATRSQHEDVCITTALVLVASTGCRLDLTTPRLLRVVVDFLRGKGRDQAYLEMRWMSSVIDCVRSHERLYAGQLSQT
ncbi:uncharacterized protein L969DRAFT_96299 [Mixia osmundae IAM 14324]|uniref:uncharacterized protein n=1 Tax=Mixia osmundae (strain CBS 9802 / IAM 14324 / JCM 22182 / KY 12970) TaxID=764103 RepID=UPI0004A54C5B|nr:uncharacterized protein L969DRAFT_96299 [Mixia osmundae IAM 14324]KEI37781.1 hypothetical protein L969DRAFT_96299 [Mixia osmundae IAM 14324]